MAGKLTDCEKVRDQLLKMMSATKNILDVRHTLNGSAPMAAAIERLKSEYVQSIVMMKSLDSTSKLPALLNPNHGALLDRQMFVFKESLAVALDEE